MPFFLQIRRKTLKPALVRKQQKNSEQELLFEENKTLINKFSGEVKNDLASNLPYQQP